MNPTDFPFINQHANFSECNELIANILALHDVDRDCLNHEESAELHLRIKQVVAKMEGGKVASLTNKDKSLHAKGVLLWARLSQTIGSVEYDSYPSRFLPQFPAVKCLTASEQNRLMAQLEKLYELDTQALTDIKDEVNFVTSNLRLKNEIINFIVKKLSLGMCHSDLLKAVTGHSALTHERIDVTITNATLFFAFEFDGKALSGETIHHSSLRDQQNIELLFDQLDLFSNVDRANFPAVGKWQALSMDETFLNELRLYLQDQCNIEVSHGIIQGTLATMSYLIPHKDAESFFVHDAYGHSWQESLCEFEHLYDHLCTLVEACPLEDFTNALSPGDDEKTVLAKCKGVLKQYYSHQVDIVTNALLAEYTADAMEFHLQILLEAKNDSIPTSSKLRHLSLFLDLSLKDTIKHISSVRLGIEKEFSTQREAVLLELFTDNQLTDGQCQSVMRELKDWFSNTITTNFSADSEAGVSRVEHNLFVQLLRIYVPLDTVARHSEATELQQLLLILTTLYQSNPATTFWQLHRYIEEFKFCSVSL
jgi:hypothetical protein